MASNAVWVCEGGADDDETLVDVLEYSVSQCPPLLAREMGNILPDFVPNDGNFRGNLADFALVSTFQRAKCDLLVFDYSDMVAEEKDRLLKNFVRWANHVRDKLLQYDPNISCDFVDPCSGFPYYTSRGSCGYSEVDAAARILKYQTDDISSCRVVYHPQWGPCSYPATLFIKGIAIEESKRLLQQFTNSTLKTGNTTMTSNSSSSS